MAVFVNGREVLDSPALLFPSNPFAFREITGVGGVDLTLTAAGSQTLAPSVGSLNLSLVQGLTSYNITIATTPQVLSVSQAISAGGADGITVKERQRLLYAANGNPYYQIWSPSAAAWLTVWWYNLNVYSQGSGLETMQFGRALWLNPPLESFYAWAFAFEYGGSPAAVPPNSGNAGIGWLGYVSNIDAGAGNGTMFLGAENGRDFAIATSSPVIGLELANQAVRRMIFTGSGTVGALRQDIIIQNADLMFGTNSGIDSDIAIIGARTITTAAATNLTVAPGTTGALVINGAASNTSRLVLQTALNDFMILGQDASSNATIATGNNVKLILTAPGASIELNTAITLGAAITWSGQVNVGVQNNTLAAVGNTAVYKVGMNDYGYLILGAGDLGFEVTSGNGLGLTLSSSANGNVSLAPGGTGNVKLKANTALLVAAANMVALASTDIAAGDARLGIQSEAGGPIYLGNNTIRVALAAGGLVDTVSLNASNDLFKVVSSRRWKTDEAPLSTWVDSRLIYQMLPKTFTWGIDSASFGERDAGLIAEDVYALDPVLATVDKKGLPSNVRWQIVHTMVLQEVQRHETEIESIKRQIGDLQDRLGVLEGV